MHVNYSENFARFQALVVKLLFLLTVKVYPHPRPPCGEPLRMRLTPLSEFVNLDNLPRPNIWASQILHLLSTPAIPVLSLPLFGAFRHRLVPPYSLDFRAI